MSFSTWLRRTSGLNLSKKSSIPIPIEKLIEASLGRSPVDILLHGEVVDVYRREISSLYVGVKDGRISYVGERPVPSRDRLEVRSGYILPAYIDGHTHIESSLLIPSQYAAAVIPKGTCCVVADPHEIANVSGVEGVRFMVEDAARTPLRVYFTIPSCVPATSLETSGATIGLREIEKLKSVEGVIGLGEVMNFMGVIRGDRSILEKIEACAGMTVDGHAPGLRGPELCAYISAGIGSDHESTTLDEASEKLSLGMWIMIREGSTSKNLHDLAPLVSRGSPERVMLVTDDVHAGDLVEEGHMDHLLKRAVEEGIDPVDAVRMATIKPAEYFGLKLLGGVAPGKWADLVVVEDLRRFKAETVLIGGEVVAEKGRYLAGFKKPPPKTALKNTMNFERIKPRDLSVRCNLGDEVAVRVIGLVEGQLYTEHLKVRMKVVNGEVRADPTRDILKVCVVERHKRTGRVGKGFLKGFGLKEGAVASSVAHDSHNVIAVGVDDVDICLAVNRLKETGGGLTVTCKGKVLSDLPLPVAGLMSMKTAGEVSAQMKRLHEAAASLGCRVESPFVALSFLSLPVIPKLKITDLGLIDVEKFEIVGLFVRDESG